MYSKRSTYVAVDRGDHQRGRRAGRQRARARARARHQGQQDAPTSQHLCIYKGTLYHDITNYQDTAQPSLESDGYIACPCQALLQVLLATEIDIKRKTTNYL